MKIVAPATTRGDEHVDEVLASVWDCRDDEDERRDLSHWRGAGRWDDEAWAAMAETIYRRVRDLFRTAGRRLGDRELMTALDWGCGGGAGLVGIAPYCRHLYGVDVSPKNLAESGRSLAAAGMSTPFVPLPVGADPTAVAEQIDRPVDLFVSTATFHLFHLKEYGEEVLRTAHAIMRPGGLGFVQIRYDDGSERYRPRQGIDRYVRDHVFASSWQLSEFWELLDGVGFAPLKIANLNTGSHFAGFYFRK